MKCTVLCLLYITVVKSKIGDTICSVPVTEAGTDLVSSVVDPDTVGSGPFFAQVGSGSGIIVPDPDVTFLTRISVLFVHIFLQNGSIRL
jgi:hypothetical protein